MHRPLAAAIALVLLAACSRGPDAPTDAAAKPTAAATAAPAPLASGVDKASFDTTVRPQDDFYSHVNGHWMATTEIPPDKSAISTGSKIRDEVQDHLREILEKAAANAAGGDADGARVGNLYASYLDEARLESLGVKPIEPVFARIDAVKDAHGLAALMGELGREFSQPGTFGPAPTLPIVGGVHQDNKDSTHYVIDFVQSGLGLPDRDYYLDDNDAKLKGIRAQYLEHVGKMFALAGDPKATENAKRVLDLETKLAAVQWTKVELRDPIKAYNKVAIADLPKLAPGFDWPAYLDAACVTGKTDAVIVSQPTYVTAFAKLVGTTPIDTWRTYLRWHALHEYAPLLSKAIDTENFAFYGTALRGTPENEPRWKRGVALVDGDIGESLGKLYVAQYFPAESKARATALVNNLLAAFSASIDTLDWMGADTKREAHAKLAKFMPKIGYPDRWRDYSTLEIKRDDLFGNVVRANAFEYQRNLAKLGAPIDRGEWGMTPQTLNAYYNPELNEIVFPAAILQPPYFDAKADDAVNYGGIGSVIGHEISHGFDDQGSQFDGDGNLRDWWTKDDHEKFAAKTSALVEQYDRYEPVKGYHINGKLTLGENIADNSGVAIAYKAYQHSLEGKPAPVLDGYSGDQRFYIGYAHVWRAKQRDNLMIERVKTDPHSQPTFRVTGALVNQAPFYAAFDVKEGDKMFVVPEKRVTIW